LAVAAVRRRAPRRNVAVGFGGRPRVAVTVDDDELVQAQLRLLEEALAPATPSAAAAA